MNSYPDFSSYGYQIQKELGTNLTGGRVTYLATALKTSQSVVIKQFQFAQSAQSTGRWNAYEAIHQEIECLEKLNHPSIPRYLDSFDPPTGICLVQEYKKAPSLASSSQFTPEEIKQIAISILEILVYLQQQHPPLIHRDIKPENILVDSRERSSLKVYLVDFGFATLGERELESSIAKGTLGFMPPEQFRNRQLTPASDLYTLGVTLICLLTGTKSENVWDLIGKNNRINFKKIKLPKLSNSFVRWLKKMVEPELGDRFSNAETALRVLKLGQVAGNAGSRSFKFNPKLIKRSAVCLLTLGLLTLVVYKSSDWAEQVRIVVKQQRQEERKKQRLDAEKKLLVLKLQETKACVGCDLSGTNLEGLFLENVDLQEANLNGANLSEAKLKVANLEGTKLIGANLKSSDLEHAKLEGANLEKANLEEADLSGANLKNANLKNANFNNATLYSANLEGANTIGATFNGAYR